MTTIGLLGGAFDPPHKGHLAMAKRVLESGLVDGVWFLPCWKHAFGKNPTPFLHRFMMCHLLVKDEPKIEVCMEEYFIESTYSVEILEHIRSAYSEHDFRLVLGADNYWKMDKWSQPKKILELASPIWIARPGEKPLPEFENAICNDVKCSSTVVRKDIRNQHFCMAALMTNDLIVKYVEREGLYQ